MLTAIRVGNFKAFAESQRIPIRPLTLIYGANSSGKSSVLHSLILARHAQETGDLDVHCTNVGGESVDLGGFRQFVHQRNTELRVHLEWEIDAEGFSRRLREILPGIKRASLGVSVGLSGSDKSLMDQFGALTPRQVLLALIGSARDKGDHLQADKLEGMLATTEDKLTLEEVSRLTSKLRVENCWIDFDAKRLINLSVRPAEHLQLDALDRDHPAMKYIVENLVKSYSTSDHIDTEELDALAAPIDELIAHISFEVATLFPHKLINKDQSEHPGRGGSFVMVKKETRVEDLRKVVELHLPPILEEVLAGITANIKNELNKVTYLGPLRAYPSRHVGFTEAHDANWVAGGGAAWDLTRKNSAIRQKVNGWLGNEKKLSTPYELRIRYLLTVESIRSKISELTSRATSKFADDQAEDLIDAFDKLEEAIDQIPEKLEKLESVFSDIQELVLFDKRTKTSVSHRDVGIGISQVLPVLVTCFASREKIIVMEQPEIHLHPALQSELGDVFVESALGERRNTLLIETHSEHVLLRVMRRMRETSDGNLPEGIPRVTPEDVCVLFVDPKGTASAVRRMELDSEGQLLDAWPGGFFEEGYRERFS